MPARIRTGDIVAVVSGNDRGRRGKVLRILKDKNRVVVEGVNMRFKHLRKSQQYPNGGRIRIEVPIHLSNVMPIDGESGQPTRVSFKENDGRLERVGRRSGAALGTSTTKKE